MSAAMPSRQQRARSERRPHESKMAAAAGSQAGTPHQSAQKGDTVTSQTPETTHSSEQEEQDAQNLSHSSSSAPQLIDKPVTYADMVKAVQDAMTPLLEKHTAQLQQAVAEIKGQVHQLAQKIQITEGRLGETFQDVFSLKEQFDTLQKSHFHLCNKVDDLENRSRRCNLRIVGLPESVKGPDLFRFLQETLPELLHIKDVCSDLVVERAHRLGPPRAGTEGRPRVVIFKSLNFIHKEAIWQASRKRKELHWEGSRLFIFQDYSAEVSRARREFAPLCSRLVKENRKFALLFPARLRLYDGNSFRDFSTVGDVEGYLRELQNQEATISLSPRRSSSSTS